MRALQAWLEAARISSGPVFRAVDRWGRVSAERLTDQVVAHVVKRCAQAAGLDPKRFAGHSLRAGLATAAALADVPEHTIMRQTRHRSVEVFRGYIRVAGLFKKNAAASVGL